MRGMLTTFSVEGLNMERLIAQAGVADVQLLGLRRLGTKRLTGCIRMEDWPQLEHLAQEGGWLLTQGEPKGAAKGVALVRKRWLICVLCALVLVLAGAATQLVWRVEITDAGTYEADIRTFLAEIGVHPLMTKEDVQLTALRDALEWRYPHVAWVECGWRGGTLCIRVVEGAQAAAPLAISGAADVVAARAGVVTSVVTLAGTPQVKVGQTVRKGEVLISGQERTGDGKLRNVAARGTVLARVWDGASVRVSGTGIEITPTGSEWIAYRVLTPWFDLLGATENPFSDSEILSSRLPLGGLFLPVMVEKRVYSEVERALIPLPREEIEAQAEALALRRLQEKVGYDEDFVDKWVDYSMIENGDSIATAICERVVDIAQRRDTP